MQFSMTAMAQDHKVRDVVVSSVKVYMMHLKTAFSFDASFALIWKCLKSFFSITSFVFPVVFAFITAISEFMACPNNVSKFVFASFADRFCEFLTLKIKVAFLRTKRAISIVSLGMIRHFALSTQILFRHMLISKIIGACDRTKLSFGLIGLKRGMAEVAGFFHNVRMHNGAVMRKHQH